MPIRFIDGQPWIDPALLQHRVTFLEQTAGSDASGSTATWVAGNPPDATWAEILPMRAEDVIKGGQDISQVRISVTLRYRADRAATARLQVPNGSQYVIEGIQNVAEMNLYLVLTCLAIGPNG